MDIRADRKYSTDHEWISVEGNVATIGITDFAQDALGDVVYVDPIDSGTECDLGDTITEVESTKSVSDIYMPITGTVVEFNSMLADVPDLLNRDPYGEGWIFKIEFSDPGQLAGLLDADAYRELTEGAA